MRKLFKSILLLTAALTSVLAGDDDIFCTEVEDSTLVRDPSACYRYFLCVDGRAFLQYCPEGQYFDFFLQGCDDIERVYCADGGGTVFPTPETTEASDVDHSMCDEVPNYQYLPSSEACNRYYQCMNGRAFPFLCPVGQFFNEPRQTCDLEDYVDCNLTTETTTSPTAPTPEPTVTPPADICVGIPNFSYVRYPNSCYRYVQCVNDVAYSFACDLGLWFNEVTSECDDPENVDCDPFIPTPPPTTTTPTPPIDACNGVADGQFIRSPFACHTYFRCENDSVAETYHCPIGEWFDEERQECDVIDNVDCDIGGTTTPSPGGDICENIPDGQFVRSPDACHIFYECNGGVAEEMVCPIGEWFDEERQECDVIENVDCDAGGVTTTPTPPPTEDICRGIDDYVYVASPTSCSLFYMCLSEVPYLVACPPGQWFDFDLQGCDLQENVECNIITTTVPPTTPSTMDENQRCIGVEDYTYIPSFESCNDYYMCRNDTAYLQSCPPGMYFDFESQNCDLPQNVDCDITTTQSTIPTDTPPVPPTPAPTTTTIAPPVDICVNVTDGQFVRSPFSCYTYHVCEDEEIQTTRLCPIGEWFDQERQECDIIDNVDCTVVGPTTPSPGGDICEDIPDGQFVRSPDACHIFYECTDGNAEEMMCPIGEWFDEERQECDIIDNVDCDIGGTTTTPYPTPPSTAYICKDIEDFVYVASPTSCSLFYMCLSEIPYLVACPPGQWFDFDIQGCDLEENVECNIITTTAPPTTPSTMDENERCIGVEDYTYIPSFESCNDYYMCRNDTAYLQSCPPGMYFDFESQNCDLPQNVDCDITTTQSTIPTDTPPVPPTPAPTTTTIAPPVDICVNVTDGQFVRSPFSCYTYHVCENEEIQTTRFCPIGEWFDQDRQECDIIENVDCVVVGPTTPSPGGDICEDIPDGQFVRSPDACYIFYECMDGNAEEMMCPIGEWFDVDRQECDIIDNVECELDGSTNTTTSPSTTTVTPTPEICEGTPDGQYVRSPNSCYLFYVCLDGVGDLRSCLAGEWFDQDRQVCDLIENVECELGNTTTITTTVSTTTLTMTTTPTPGEDICEARLDGELVRHPVSCYIFYECNNGTAGEEQSCPIGKWFDQQRQECDEIDNVECDS